jgi:hypothetical protein
MYYSNLLCVFFVMTPVSIFSENVRLLDRQEINKKAVVIEKKLARERYFVLGLTTLGHIHNIYIFLSFLMPSKPLKNMCEACKIKEVELVKNVPFGVAMRSGLINAAQNVKNLFVTPQGWGTIGQYILYYGGFLSASFFTARVADNLIHPDTLHWYIAKHVPYESTVQLMKEVIVSLRVQKMTDEGVAYNVQILKDSLNRLAGYGESICAYMTYKSHYLEDDEKQVANRAIGYFFSYYNAWLIDVFVQCSLKSPYYDQINASIASYEINVAAQLRHFYAIEGETEIDQLAMDE